MRIRSGFSDFDLAIASSPLSAVTHWNPFLDRVSMKNCRSVGESSTIRIFFTAMADLLGAYRRVRAHSFQQAVLGERLGQVLVRTHHPAARPIEQSVLRGEHDHGRPRKMRVLLDERAGLVPVQARHQNVHEYDIGLVIRDLRECVEAVLSQNHLASGLDEKNLGAATNRVRIVDHHDFDAGQIRRFAHSPSSDLCLSRQLRRTVPYDAGLDPPSPRFHTIQPSPVKTKPCAAYFRSPLRIVSDSGFRGSLHPFGIAEGMPGTRIRPSRNPPCGRHTPGRSSSWVRPPSGSPPVFPPPEDPPPRCI